MAIARTVAFTQGKGGVGKTSLTTNVAGLLAASELRVLVVDLDPQGNVARDLGYEPRTGRELSTALVAGQPLPIIRDQRPGLDVVPGGPALADAAAYFASSSGRGDSGDLGHHLEAVLEPIAGDYDLILMDTPPGDRAIVLAAMHVASMIVIPTRPDEASIDGVTLVAQRVMEARKTNPDLRVGGVALFALETRGQRVERDVRSALDGILGGAAPLFNTTIRHLQSAAADARRRGLLVHELEEAGAAAKKSRLAALRAASAADGDERRAILDAERDSSFYSSAKSASGLAADYEALANEIVAIIGAIESEQGA